MAVTAARPNNVRPSISFSPTAALPSYSCRNCYDGEDARCVPRTAVSACSNRQPGCSKADEGRARSLYRVDLTSNDPAQHPIDVGDEMVVRVATPGDTTVLDPMSGAGWWTG